MVGSVRRPGRTVVASAVAALLAVAIVGIPASAAPSSWQSTPVPTKPNEQFVMASVSCPAARACFALTGGDPTEVEQWNGRRWHMLPTAPRFSVDLDCPTTSMCVAVGGLGNRPSADIWDGAGWTPSTLKGPGGYAALSGISCVSATWCMASGYDNGTSFFERFDGTKWTLIDAPVALHKSAMDDVSCTSETNCVAVGNTANCRRCESVALAETWNGEQWKITKTPPSPGPDGNVLLRVSCGSSDRCVAVGFHDAEFIDPLVEQWNGRSWKRLPDPVPPGAMGSHVDDVACAHGVDCVVVGDWYGPDGSGTFGQLIASWNGTAWSYPEIQLYPHGELTHVDCFDAHHCVADGRDFTDAVDKPLAFVGTTPAGRARSAPRS